MTSRAISLGTRGSRLALAQARIVADALTRHHSGLRVSIDPIVTEGDEGPPSVPPPRRGAKELFTGRIEAALLERRIDVAVHSMKDLPAEPVEGLAIGAIPAREEPRDALVSTGQIGLDAMHQGFRVGTASLRRQAQLRAARPDVVIQAVRGNVDTRLRKMHEQRLDGIVLAAAGLHRLGRADVITELLPTVVMLPAPAQGALAVQARTDDAHVMDVVRPLDHPGSRIATVAERALARALGSDCNVPVGALAQTATDVLRLEACVGRPDGTTIVRRTMEGPLNDPERLGARLARRLLDDGADHILQEAKPE